MKSRRAVIRARAVESPGWESPDPTPVTIPVERLRPPSYEERIRAFIRGEVSRHAQLQGEGSFEDEDDFEEEDLEPDLLSDYQVLVMAEEAGLGETLDGTDSPRSSPAEPDATAAVKAAPVDAEGVADSSG